MIRVSKRISIGRRRVTSPRTAQRGTRSTSAAVIWAFSIIWARTSSSFLSSSILAPSRAHCSLTLCWRERMSFQWRLVTMKAATTPPSTRAKRTRMRRLTRVSVLRAM
jgi:hypothetical protein